MHREESRSRPWRKSARESLVFTIDVEAIQAEIRGSAQESSPSRNRFRKSKPLEL